MLALMYTVVANWTREGEFILSEVVSEMQLP